jgi:hypothetical protein
VVGVEGMGEYKVRGIALIIIVGMRGTEKYLLVLLIRVS